MNFSEHPLCTIENEEYHALKFTITLEVALFVLRRQVDSLLQFGNIDDILNTQSYGLVAGSFFVVGFGLMSLNHVS